MRQWMPDGAAPDSDWVLDAVDRALLGDRSALEALYVRYAESVEGYARSILHDDHEAQDVSQQVFLKLMTSLGTFHAGRGNFHGWLLRVARNAALDTLRRRRALPVAEVYGPDVGAPEGPSESAETLTELINALPMRQRQVVVLFKLGLTAAEIAGVTHMTEGAVHVLNHRAKKRLGPELERRGMAPASVRNRRQPAPVVPLQMRESQAA